MALSWLIRVLVIIVIVRLGWKFLVGLFSGVTQRPKVTPKRGVPLVRDPICGTYVAQSRAVAFQRRGEVHYFCSERCLAEYRQKWQESTGSSK
ncbi:MAG: hypothetical protein CL484_07675 [Acidobacteria bacterium]|nr:hypothetical protein [Acidobacteriota bacterium]